MRAYEFLFEYSKKQIISQFGIKLIDAALKDRGFVDEPLLSARNRYQTDKDEKSLLDSIIATIEQGDPSVTKSYTHWLAKQYASGTIKIEDIVSKMYDWLKIYDTLKNRNKLSPDSMNIMKLSIQNVIDIANNPELKSMMQQKPEVDRGEYEEILNNEQVRIIVPHDKTSACYYGRGTTWCTAAENSNQFQNYARDGNLYILIPKHPEYAGEKYQLHIETGSLTDESNDQVDSVVKFLQTRFGDLVTFFKEYDPTLKNILLFVDDNTLIPIIEKIHQCIMENYVYDQLQEWEDNDYQYYYEYLEDQGYVDEDGEVDWDVVEKNRDSWLNWNDEAGSWYESMQKLDVAPQDIKDQSVDDATIFSTEMAYAAYLENDYSAPVRAYRVFDTIKPELIDFIKSKILIKKENDEIKVVCRDAKGNIIATY